MPIERRLCFIIVSHLSCLPTNTGLGQGPCIYGGLGARGVFVKLNVMTRIVAGDMIMAQ